MAAERTGRVERRTRETDVTVEVAVDGPTGAEVATGVPFLDHMLTALAVHGRFGLRVLAMGDLEVDAHHTVEDVAIVLGEAFAVATGDRAGTPRTENAFSRLRTFPAPWSMIAIEGLPFKGFPWWTRACPPARGRARTPAGARPPAP